MKKDSFTIKVEDCGGYWQVYLMSQACESKLGNIYPPGYKLFGEVVDAQCFVGELTDNRRVRWQSLLRALAWIISPRGTS